MEKNQPNMVKMLLDKNADVTALDKVCTHSEKDCISTADMMVETIV